MILLHFVSCHSLVPLASFDPVLRPLNLLQAVGLCGRGGHMWSIRNLLCEKRWHCAVRRSVQRLIADARLHKSMKATDTSCNLFSSQSATPHLASKLCKQTLVSLLHLGPHIGSYHVHILATHVLEDWPSKRTEAFRGWTAAALEVLRSADAAGTRDQRDLPGADCCE